jgi:hypothetical protein
MGVRLGAILIFTAFLNVYVGFELSEENVLHQRLLQTSGYPSNESSFLDRTVVLSPDQSLGFPFTVLILASTVFLFSGLMLAWPSPGNKTD